MRGRREIGWVSIIIQSTYADHQTRNDRLVESAASLLGAIVTILSPLPFFRTSLITMVTKVLGKSEPYGDIVSRKPIRSISRVMLMSDQSIASVRTSRSHTGNFELCSRSRQPRSSLTWADTRIQRKTRTKNVVGHVGRWKYQEHGQDVWYENQESRGETAQ
jgi:hypothetical protein